MKLVKIGAIWCSACLIVNERFKKVSINYPEIEFIEYDVDIDDVKKYNVCDRIPVIILEEDDKELDRLVG